ncbi:MAG: hypothetical protein ABIH18_04485 [Candidatus Omnitrophota bacterium]
METSIFFAKLLGSYFIIIGIGILFNLKTYQKLVEDFFKNYALIYLGGLMALIFGLLTVLFHNVWAADWVVIITIFGWMGIIKGIWLIVFPNAAAKMTQFYKQKASLLLVHSLIVLGLGVFLAVKGY